jgi:alkylation response protein AidB-like acyl-CoA dehydrogenase
VDLEPTEEQIALRATVRRLLADHAPVGSAARAVADGTPWAPDRAWQELEALGAFELLVPDSGSGLIDAAIVAEELGRVAYPGPWLDAVSSTGDAALVLLGADALGAASAVMDLAVEYAKVRHQFGQPIGAFQSVAHLCVDMLETVELARGTVLHAAWAADAGDPVAHRAALRLKASSDRLLGVGETAIQVLGGIGYTWEHDAHLFVKRLMAWTTARGTASAARIELARLLSPVNPA